MCDHVRLNRAAGAERFVRDRLCLDDDEFLLDGLLLLTAVLDKRVVLLKIGEKVRCQASGTSASPARR